MKSKTLIIIILFISGFFKQIYAQSLAWAHQISGNGYDLGQAINVDLSGNVYTAGQFDGTVDFDPGPGTYTLATAGSRDVFVTKHDPSGNLIWARQLGGTNVEYANSITTDVNGNVYIAGSFPGTTDFNPGPSTYTLSSAGTDDIFICKLDVSGNFVWVRQIGNTGPDKARSIADDGSGNIYFTGSFWGTVDFDPGPSTVNLTSAGNADGFICKLDGSGNFVYAKSFGGSGLEDVYGLALDGGGNIYISGYFNGTTDLDPSSTLFNVLTFGGYDIFIVKLDSLANFIWGSHLGGINDEYCYGLGLDGSGNVYTTGRFSGSTDFDPGSPFFYLTSAGNEDIFVSKLDNTGNFLWAKSFGSSSGDRGYSIAVDLSGNCYTTGFFAGTVDFDPGTGTFNLVSASFGDVFVSCLDASGNFVSAVSFAGGGAGNGIAVDAPGNIYTTGGFQTTTDFDPGPGILNFTPLTTGISDGFIHKMSKAPTNLKELIGASSVLLYPNPNCGILTVNASAKNYSFIITDLHGKTVLEKHDLNSPETVDISKLDAGVYIYVVRSENEALQGKLVKN